MKDHSEENSMVTGPQFEEATVSHSPDPDDMEFYYIDKHVLQIGTLSERTQQARNDFSQERADPEIMDGMLGEWLILFQKASGDVSGISDRVGALERRLQSSLYQGGQA